MHIPAADGPVHNFVCFVHYCQDKAIKSVFMKGLASNMQTPGCMLGMTWGSGTIGLGKCPSSQ